MKTKKRKSKKKPNRRCSKVLRDKAVRGLAEALRGEPEPHIEISVVKSQLSMVADVKVFGNNGCHYSFEGIPVVRMDVKYEEMETVEWPTRFLPGFFPNPQAHKHTWQLDENFKSGDHVRCSCGATTMLTESKPKECEHVWQIDSQWADHQDGCDTVRSVVNLSCTECGEEKRKEICF